ncbi:MAG TPA: hypothetical protein DEQ43_14010, partial [Nocardioides bacterium]|nr:hypothetical protein [Nocardioides sp.]
MKIMRPPCHGPVTRPGVTSAARFHYLLSDRSTSWRGRRVPDQPLPLGARVLAAGALALPSGIVVDGWVVIDGKRVLTAGSGTPPERPSWSVAGLVVPGFVDVHVHGGGGASFD